jgi:hypothetical protein
LLLLGTQAGACRHTLILALDVSGSVNPTEYQQQVTGFAAALSGSKIRDLILADTHKAVALAVFDWPSQNYQYVIVSWTHLNTSAALQGVINRILVLRRVRVGLKTALGTALRFVQSMLNHQASCWQHVIDVSAGGRINLGTVSRQVYRQGFDRTVVNALVMGNPEAASGEGPGIDPDALLDDYERKVLHGLGAFYVVANGYVDYARAMRIKLERELQPLVFGAAR